MTLMEVYYRKEAALGDAKFGPGGNFDLPETGENHWGARQQQQQSSQWPGRMRPVAHV